MKRFFCLILVICPAIIFAQKSPKNKKYPSLLWEISGNGLKKPSYLFGTMHVSSKIAFHLADSFYIGLRNADVVALETNPESWQEDMNKYNLNSYAYGRFGNYQSAPSDYLTEQTLKFFKYDKKVERSLYSNPSMINNLLYRSYGNESSDFEEDTYLDMHIYQVGKKWGKKVAGVENYAESMKLMQEAYRDAEKDVNKKLRRGDVEEEYDIDKLQEAYRKGNLDQLDSINKLNSYSSAFDEKFLYKRNEIQAYSIDSILKKKQTLFAGVGAAHLPGERGVIEILRKLGYKLRPIMMGERDSRHKDEVEKIRVPVKFQTEYSDDKFFKVDIPGKFYKFGEDGALDQRQYADMANGSYYMVTRIMTNSWMWGHSEQDVMKTIDSLLYENIPGKMLSKTPITKNGFRGYDIVNRTRRGDMQRYNIFVTPFEIIFFKISGNSEYVRIGEEASKFFNSIQFQPYYNPSSSSWMKFSPSYGSFSVDMPHQPYMGNDGSWIFDAIDPKDNNHYRLIRTDIHNYSFTEEDSFDLTLMDESFAASEFLDKKLNRKMGAHKNYPALDVKYAAKDGSVYLTRYIIKGPHYYTLIAHGKKETPKMNEFLNSLEFKPFVYPAATLRTDTSMFFTVKSPVFPEAPKEKLETYFNSYDEDEEDDGRDVTDGRFNSLIIANDTTGEKIYVSFLKAHRYYHTKDTGSKITDYLDFMSLDTNWVNRSEKKTTLKDSTRVWDIVRGSKTSSRVIRTRIFEKDGIEFIIRTQGDTLSAPSGFVSNFFETFSPADTLVGTDISKRKSGIFFRDFMSNDSIAHKRAVKYFEDITLDSSDLDLVKTAISWLTWDKKKYLEKKKSLISKLGEIKTKQSADFLKQQYYTAGDTLDLQHAAIEALLQHKTSYAFSVFRDIILNEPPVLTIGQVSNRNIYTDIYWGGYRNDNFMDQLNDSLELTKNILPAILPLLNLDDYKEPVMRLLGKMVDEKLVVTKDYETYFDRFLLEGKQTLKKQALLEKSRAILKAEESKSPAKPEYPGIYSDDDDDGNEDLSLYARLLMPFWDKNEAVRNYLNQLLAMTDKKLRYETLLLFLVNGKKVEDSVINEFAAADEYRFRLYEDLQKKQLLNKFPPKYNNHKDLAKSRVYSIASGYNKPDTVVYLDRLFASAKAKKGFVYFFKYKNKKEDMVWKIATVGLVPENEKEFLFESQKKTDKRSFNLYTWQLSPNYDIDFNSFTDTKLKDDEPLTDQLQKELKKKLYSKRKSGRQFYQEDKTDQYEMFRGY